MQRRVTDLHPVLVKDCRHIAMLPLSYVLLLDDSRFPWFLLVPDRHQITDISELEDSDQLQLFHESMALNRTMQQVFSPERMNIACIGNMVPQLHVHHIARFTDDPCWPAPVWGHCQSQGNPIHYTDKDIADMVNRVREPLESHAAFHIDWISDG